MYTRHLLTALQPDQLADNADASDFHCPRAAPSPRATGMSTATTIGVPELITVGATTALTVGVVLLHYEGLNLIGKAVKSRVLHHRAKIVAVIFAQLALHVSEIWLFAATLFGLTRMPGYGTVAPTEGLVFLDYVYFSAITYTTVGFGELVPQGAIRFLCGVEALSGLSLITWSASFTFLEMQRYWGRD